MKKTNYSMRIIVFLLVLLLTFSGLSVPSYNATDQDEIGYQAETDAEKEDQRLALLDAMYYNYAPVIISRAYDETFVENGTALNGAPSRAGTYHVLAETVPFDPENPYEYY